MVAYFLLSLVTGPVFSVRVGASPAWGLAGWAATAFLAWRVTRGGRVSRMLLILTAWTGVIEGVITPAIRFSPDPLALAACGAQLALLLSPAVYQRTRPARPGTGRVALWRRRRPARLVAALAAGAVLGLAGAAASAALISGRSHDYDSATVRLPAGHPVQVTLAPGSYSAFGGCIDRWGCAGLSPRDLSVRGALSGPVRVVPYGGFDTKLPGFEQRTVDGQLFVRELAFTVPVREPVQMTLNVHPRQPVLVAPTPDKTGLLLGGIIAASGSALLFLGSLAGLTLPLGAPARPRAT
jgi:hypothetical protein